MEGQGRGKKRRTQTIQEAAAIIQAKMMDGSSNQFSCGGGDEK